MLQDNGFGVLALERWPLYDKIMSHFVSHFTGQAHRLCSGEAFRVDHAHFHEVGKTSARNEER